MSELNTDPVKEEPANPPPRHDNDYDRQPRDDRDSVYEDYWIIFTVLVLIIVVIVLYLVFRSTNDDMHSQAFRGGDKYRYSQASQRRNRNVYY